MFQNVENQFLKNTNNFSKKRLYSIHFYHALEKWRSNIRTKIVANGNQRAKPSGQLEVQSVSTVTQCNSWFSRSIVDCFEILISPILCLMKFLEIKKPCQSAIRFSSRKTGKLKNKPVFKNLKLYSWIKHRNEPLKLASDLNQKYFKLLKYIRKYNTLSDAKIKFFSENLRFYLTDLRILKLQEN